MKKQIKQKTLINDFDSYDFDFECVQLQTKVFSSLAKVKNRKLRGLESEIRGKWVVVKIPRSQRNKLDKKSKKQLTSLLNKNVYKDYKYKWDQFSGYCAIGPNTRGGRPRWGGNTNHGTLKLHKR